MYLKYYLNESHLWTNKDDEIEGDMSTCLWYEEREKGCQVNSVYGERRVQLS